jgi:serine/threonine protein kinase
MQKRPGAQDNTKEQAQSRLLRTELIYTLNTADPDPWVSAGGAEIDEILWPPGKVIDKKYVILGLLGQGGMGAVYKAHHEQLNKDIALKTFRIDEYSEEAWKRFQQEAKILASLNDSHVVQIYDFNFSEDDVPFFTMELLNGQALDEKLKEEGSLKLETTIDIFIQVCQGLEAAHNRGILHRDIKPANIFLEVVGQNRKVRADSGGFVKYNVKILDFGIGTLISDGNSAQGITVEAGSCFGSPLYMSPEQATGANLTAATDIYSCGCALFQVLTGEPPFLGKNAFATLRMHQEKKPPALSEKFAAGVIPERLDRLLAKMIEKDPARRFQSIKEVGEQLKELATNDFTSQQLSIAATETKGLADEHVSVRSKRRAKLSLILGLPVLALVGLLMSVVRPWQHTQVPSAGAIRNMANLPTFEAVKKNLGAKAPSVAPTKYLVTTEADRKNSMRRFQFPQGKRLGRLRIAESSGAGLEYAQGTVVVPASSRLILSAGAELCSQPQLFEGFGPNDLYVLTLDDLTKQEGFVDENWNESHMKEIAKLTGLREFYCNQADLTSSSARPLGKLKNLHLLAILGAKSDVSWLADFEPLSKLEDLRISHSFNLQSMAGRLVNEHSNIGRLELSDCNLDDKTVQSIALLQNLQYLDLSDNHGVTDASLDSLSKAPMLKQLILGSTGISPACVSKLNKFKNLQFLSIESTLLSPKQLALLKAGRGKNFSIYTAVPKHKAFLSN